MAIDNLLKIYKGDRAEFTATITQGGAAFDLTGYTATLYIKKYKEDEDIVLEEDGIIGQPPTGVIEFILSPSETLALTAQEYHYEVKIYKTDYVYTPIVDRIKIEITLEDDPLT
jgi:hypothetical protein